ncbi:MAG: DMT family transporter [Deltaproteobacteria bacterium]|nr:DMT family transporter [Deltaproteobacteria bacterium]
MLRDRLAVVGAALLFATGGAAIKSTTLDGFTVAGGRSAIAALTLGLAFPEARRRWTWASLLVGLAFAATLVLFVLGNKYTTGANAIFLQSAAPLYLLLLGPWLLRERIARRDVGFMVALGVGLTLFCVDTAGATSSAPRPTLGNALATASGLTWAFTLAGLRWLERRSDGAAIRSVVVGNALAATIGLVPFALGEPPTMSGVDLGLLVYLGVFQIGLAYAWLTHGLRRLSAFEGALLVLVEPALSPIVTFWVHGERPSTLALAGGALIVVISSTKGILDALRPEPE